MTNSLYDLSAAYLAVLDEMPEEIDQQTVNDTLEAIDGAIEEKAFNIVAYAKDLEGQAKVIEAEEKRLSARRKAYENRAKSIKTYLQGTMEKLGRDKIKGDLFTIALQNNPGTVQISNEKAIPTKYLTIVPAQYVPDKKAIAAALKNGEDVPGCEFIRSRRLAIR